YVLKKRIKISCFVFSGVKENVQKDSRRKWLTAAFLLSSAMLGYLLSRSYLFSEDGVTEVLAHHGENIPNKFIEVPCSEDYDSHKRFEAMLCHHMDHLGVSKKLKINCQCY
uniref:Uncharacterized protein n=1 Tax=Naja naja TaxID=35670 RepID=A0A8C6YHR3_NAJNA